MIQEKIDTYEFTDDDFIHHSPPWHANEQPELSKFDHEVQHRWKKAMAAGVFRYGIDHIITRIIPGSKRYVGQLNTLRATERRKPQDILSVNQPFNENAFCFSCVKPEEVIFNLKNVTNCKCKDMELDTRDPALHGKDPEINTRQPALINGDRLAVSRKSAAESQLESEDVKRSEHFDESKVTKTTKDSCEHTRHTLIVNVSPMEFGHCLLVPEIDLHKPQVLTETSIRVAIETMLLSGHRGLRMGFNSLCAFASVNHLHFHLYYLEHQLIVDYYPVHHLGGRYYEFTGLPCPGLALQLYGSTVSEMARSAYRISSYFHENDIAHNVFLCRGTVFGEDRNSKLTTIRLYLWPRKKFIGKKSAEEFNVACIELGGHLPIKEVDGYHRLTEEEVDAIIGDAQLPTEQYQSIRDQVIRMGLEEELRMVESRH